MECALDDLTVHYQVRGAGRPLLMLHGWGLDHRHMWSEMEPVFEGRTGWQRLYIDLPGCGQTASRPWIRNQDDILDVVLAFVDTVVTGQRFAVAGASAGGLLARGVAYRRGPVMDGLLLTVPLAVAEDARRDRPDAVTLVEDAALLAELGEDDAERLVGAVVQSRAVLEALERDYGPASEIADQEWLQQIRTDPARYGLSFDVDEPDTPFPAPTLILLGRQDSAVGYRDQWRFVENYPRGTVAILDRAGHLLEVHQQALFRMLVREWLDRVEEYAGS